MRCINTHSSFIHAQVVAIKTDETATLFHTVRVNKQANVAARHPLFLTYSMAAVQSLYCKHPKRSEISWRLMNLIQFFHVSNIDIKKVRADCYCATLLRTLFIRHALATSFSSALTESKTQQNIELMTFALTWWVNIFVGCSVTPTFFFSRSLPFLILHIILKNKKICAWAVMIISHILFK